jgi:class 3 adenylate cyclase
VRLTVRNGLAASSAVDFAHYALLQIALGRYEDGAYYGELAMRLAEREPCRARRAWCAFLYHDFVHHWKYDIRSSIEPLRESHRDAMERGDPESAALLGVVELFESFQAGIALPEIVDRATALDRTFRHQAYFTQLAGVTMQFVTNVMGRADEPAVLVGPYYDDRAPAATSAPAVLSAVAMTRLALLFWLGRFEEAAELLDPAEAVLAGQTGNPNVPWFHLQNAIVRLRVAPKARETRKAVAESARLFRRWSRLSASNFGAQDRLIAAEEARAGGDTAAAVALFEQAIATAEGGQSVLVAALAHRCAGDLHDAEGHDERSQFHYRRAVQVFRRIGADALGDAIVAEHPAADAPRAAPSAETVHLEQLDLLAMLRSSQALARDLDLADLLRTLLETVERHLGAERALVFIRRDNGLVLGAATGTTEPFDGGETGDERGHVSVEDVDDCIADLVRLVARTREPVVLDDAQLSDYRDHPHVRTARVRSVLCAPVVSRSDVVGVLYLENNRHPAAFTGRPQEVLSLLSGQIAVSLQNAQLVEALQGALDSQLELTTAQSRFIPDQFLRALGKSDIRDVALGNAVGKELTVMVSDMRGSTGHLELMEPEDAMTFINEYLRYLEPPIAEHGGFVDSYTGDGMLALFDGGADSAVRAALAMLRAQRQYNRVRSSRGEGSVRSGIGLNTGSLVLGPMGGTDRLKFSVFGDAVNLAARLEAFTKACGAELLLSEQTYGNLVAPIPYRTRRIGRVRLRGRAAPVLVREIFDDDPEFESSDRWACLPDYEAALDLYLAGDVKAAFSLFARCASTNADDRVIQGYLHRCQALLRAGMPTVWDGTIEGDDKAAGV